MSSLALVQSLQENVSKNAGVRTIFGEAVASGDSTILPVARVAYGFGGGGGSNPSAENGKAEGGGGGGGVRINPVGLFVIGPTETRFVPAEDRKRSAALVLLGLAVGWMLARGRSRRVLRWKGVRIPLS